MSQTYTQPSSEPQTMRSPSDEKEARIWVFLQSETNLCHLQVQHRTQHDAEHAGCSASCSVEQRWGRQASQRGTITDAMLKKICSPWCADKHWCNLNRSCAAGGAGPLNERRSGYKQSGALSIYRGTTPTCCGGP